MVIEPVGGRLAQAMLAMTRSSSADQNPSAGAGFARSTWSAASAVSVTPAETASAPTPGRSINTPNISRAARLRRSGERGEKARVEMFETMINLKPENQWRPGVTVDALTAEMDKALQFPGISNAWSHGTGSELMQRIAVPMIGGIVSSTTLVVIPAVYAMIKGCQLLHAAAREQPAPSPAK
jgi:Cu/Ag efflux pump CusA